MKKHEKEMAKEVIKNGGFWARSISGNGGNGIYHRYRTVYTLRCADGSHFETAHKTWINTGLTMINKLGGAIVPCNEINSFVKNRKAQ